MASDHILAKTTQVRKQNSKSQSYAPSIDNLPTPASPDRSGRRHTTLLGWKVHDLSKKWIEFCERYAGNGEEQGSVRFDWAHDGKKANGWIELLPDKDRCLLHFPGAGWGSGQGSWKAHGEDLEVCFGTSRHILSLNGSEDRWTLKEKYSLKNRKAALNPGTAGWPATKSEVQSQKNQNKRMVDEDTEQPQQKRPRSIVNEKNAPRKESKNPKKSKATAANKHEDDEPELKNGVDARAVPLNLIRDIVQDGSLPVHLQRELKACIVGFNGGFDGGLHGFTSLPSACMANVTSFLLPCCVLAFRTGSSSALQQCHQIHQSLSLRNVARRLRKRLREYVDAADDVNAVDDKLQRGPGVFFGQDVLPLPLLLHLNRLD